MSHTKTERNRARIPADERVLACRAAAFGVLSFEGLRQSRRARASLTDPAGVSTLEDWRLRRIVAAVSRELAARERLAREWRRMIRDVNACAARYTPRHGNIIDQ